MAKRRKKDPAAETSAAGSGQEDNDRLAWDTMNSITRSKISWLMPGFIPRGMITVLEGRKGVGKSTLLAAFVAYATGGNALPGSRKTKSPRSALWLSGEEAAGTLVYPRLANAGANLGMVIVPRQDVASGQQRKVYLPGDLEQLTDLVKTKKLGLLVADPWVSFLRPEVDVNQEGPVRSVLEPLGNWAARWDVTVLLVRHLKKGSAGSAIEQGLGSVAVANVARSVLRADKHPLLTNSFTLCKVGGNAGGNQATLIYTIEGVDNSTVIRWQGESQLDAETIAESSGDGGERDARRDAIRLLVALIAKRWVPFNDVLSEAKNAGIGERTLRTVKAELNIPSRRSTASGAAHWEWGPPLKGWPKEWDVR